MAHIQPAEHHYQAAAQAAEILEMHGYEAYIVGGAVRDILLGHLPKDFDLVTNARPAQILQINEFSKSRFDDGAQAFGVSRVVIQSEAGPVELEIATFRRDIEAHLGRKATKIEFAHLEDDLLRRDLTINALALDPASSCLIDYTSGLADLEAGLIRFIGTPAQRIKEDALRILRAIRLKNQLDFGYETETETGLSMAIANGQLQAVAADRLRQELNRMLVHSRRSQAIADLDMLGALQLLLPELVAAKGVAQPPHLHGEGDVYEHTLLTLDNIGSHPSVRLAWAGLLHDIGKPPTAIHNPGERIRFNQHYSVGAQMARTILGRFNFSKKAIEQISWLVHYHLAIDELPSMRPSHRQAMLAHPAFADLLRLHKADAMAAWSAAKGGGIDISQPDFSALEELWEEYQLQAHTQPINLKTQLGIDGHWLSSEFDLSGKELGQVLEELNRAFADGQLASQAQAKDLVQRLLKKS